MTAPTGMETTCPGPGLRFHWPVFGVGLPVVGQPAGRLDGLPAAPELAAVLAGGRHTDVGYSLAAGRLLLPPHSWPAAGSGRSSDQDAR